MMAAQPVSGINAASGFSWKEHPFTVLAAEKWGQVAGLAPPLTYPAATKLFQQGTAACAVYFIERGLVKLVCLGNSGRESIVGLRAAGWMLGAASAIAQSPYPITAVTLTRCYLRRIATADFTYWVERNSEISRYLHQMHSHEILEQISQVTQLRCVSVQLRLEQLIWKLISALEIADSASGVRLQLPLRHWEIAESIAVTPEHLSRVFRRMEQAGVMHWEKRWLVIPDRHKLRHF